MKKKRKKKMKKEEEGKRVGSTHVEAWDPI
jgi:hypothetical protein